MVNNKGRGIDDKDALAATVGVNGQPVCASLQQVDEALAGVRK